MPFWRHRCVLILKLTDADQNSRLPLGFIKEKCQVNSELNFSLQG